MDIPMNLKNAIESKAGQVGGAALSKAAREISLKYRTQKGSGQRLLATDTEVLAYAITRMPATYGAVYKALKGALSCHSGEIRSVLDVGAGTGAASWAAQALLPTYARYLCLEREPAMARLGQALMAEQEELCDATWLLQDMTAGLQDARADLVMASYALNELTPTAREKAVAALWEAAQQLLVIVEPGTPEGAAQLKGARAQLLALGGHVVAPCPHQALCPLAAEDWCHFTVRIARSRLHKQLKGGEVPYEDEKFCYLAVAKQPGQPCGARVLRHPQIEAGRIGLRLCTAAGCTEQRLVTKSSKEAFKQARKCEAGDGLEI